MFGSLRDRDADSRALAATRSNQEDEDQLVLFSRFIGVENAYSRTKWKSMILPYGSKIPLSFTSSISILLSPPCDRTIPERRAHQRTIFSEEGRESKDGKKRRDSPQRLPEDPPESPPRSPARLEPTTTPALLLLQPSKEFPAQLRRSTASRREDWRAKRFPRSSSACSPERSGSRCCCWRREFGTLEVQEEEREE